MMSVCMDHKGINDTSAGSASEERSTVFIQPNDRRRCASVARSRDYIRDDRTEGSKRCRTQIHPRDYIRRRDKSQLRAVGPVPVTLPYHALIRPYAEWRIMPSDLIRPVIQQRRERLDSA